jgi:beta-lactamase superfamily II metal-dependent hydrolase
LIDGGPNTNALAQVLGRTLPATVRTLDVVLATSPKTGSSGGLPALLGRYTIGQVVTASDSSNREWAEGLAARNISTTQAEVGQWFDMGDGARLEVVDVNSDGATLWITYGKASFLLPFGLDDDSATEIAEAGRISPATILVLNSEDALTQVFMNAVQPRSITMATHLKDELQPETLALLNGYTVLRTGEHGTIRFATDGAQLWVEAEQ